MSHVFKMSPQREFNSNSLLYKALRRLYYFGQFLGCISFSYSPSIGVHVKLINVVTFLIWFIFYTGLSQTIKNSKLTIHAKGLQEVLFDLNIKDFLSGAPSTMWSSTFSLFLFRKKVAKLMEDIMALDSEASDETQLLNNIM